MRDWPRFKTVGAHKPTKIPASRLPLTNRKSEISIESNVPPM